MQKKVNFTSKVITVRKKVQIGQYFTAKKLAKLQKKNNS